ncbi:hypothetical protein Aph02nite_67860 [Actinoplanes philippinensis]|uniref:DUF4192 domain-containing protein n=1 Tax=Actinoplanes philippinensis TaxID=35752 RepID=A0A1I2LQ38_9ACTN|nr:DUF4192 domain-containing protein [Actinoplanes philippinensis]GIE80836.1 hypothetical protein Aph02nite_67860 [Actinoplanes philippinensis]SFF79161.1 protein of unknown function [Actinoplanes philippinensis]
MRADTTLVVNNSAELVAVLPFLMGYHPHETVALVGMRDGRIDFGACFNLPPPDIAEPDLRSRTREVVAGILRQEPDLLVIVGYGPPARITPVVLRIAEVLQTVGVRIDDVLRVHEGRWWSYACEDRECCPAEGTPCLPPDSVIAAEATYRGQVALPSRRDLVAQVASLDGPVRVAMTAATERARKRFHGLLEGDGATKRIRQAGRLAVREAEKRYRSGGVLTDAETAWLGVLLTDLAVEDYAVDRTGEHEWRASLWTDVLRRVEPVYVPAPACLLGFTAWQLGRGALARVAVDRALDVEPGHELAGMLHQLLGFAISPAVVRRWRR